MEYSLASKRGAYHEALIHGRKMLAIASDEKTDDALVQVTSILHLIGREKESEALTRQ